MPYRSPDQYAVTPQHRGRFPGYDVLDEAHRWDDVTAGVVLARLAPTTDLSFFTMAENARRRCAVRSAARAGRRAESAGGRLDRRPTGNR